MVEWLSECAIPGRRLRPGDQTCQTSRRREPLYVHRPAQRCQTVLPKMYSTLSLVASDAHKVFAHNLVLRCQGLRTPAGFAGYDCRFRIALSVDKGHTCFINQVVVNGIKEAHALNNFNALSEEINMSTRGPKSCETFDNDDSMTAAGESVSQSRPGKTAAADEYFQKTMLEGDSSDED